MKRVRDGGSWRSRGAQRQNTGERGVEKKKTESRELTRGRVREGEWAEVERERAGRIAGSDAGWGVFDQQPAFHPRQSAQRRTGREKGRDGGREGDAERGGRKGGHCCLNAPLLPAECQHLSLSTPP